jgi:hypothetical protein
MENVIIKLGGYLITKYKKPINVYKLYNERIKTMRLIVQNVENKEITKKAKKSARNIKTVCHNGLIRNNKTQAKGEIHMVTNYNTLTLSQVLALNEKGYTFELNDGSIKEINRELSFTENHDNDYLEECVGF